LNTSVGGDGLLSEYSTKNGPWHLISVYRGMIGAAWGKNSAGADERRRKDMAYYARHSALGMGQFPVVYSVLSENPEKRD
jgi:hypothetical protein